MTQAPVENASQHRAPLPPGWKPDASTFGARLALIRWQLGYNIAEAARECDIPAQSWRSWEIYDRTPRDLIAVATQIAERVGCDRMWLMVGDETASAA